jgi:general secretion pathway protein G
MKLSLVAKTLLRPFATKTGVKSQAGMTIIEILIVIALMGTIMTLVVTQVLDVGEGAKVDASRIGMGRLESTLQMYKIHNYRYPTTEQGLEALVTKPSDAKRWRGPYTEKGKLDDPWGTPYTYESDGKNFKIISAGPDLEMGTSDDITYPDDGGAGGELE